MADADPFAKYATPAPAAAAPDAQTGDQPYSLVGDYQQRVHQAAEGLWQDVTTPLRQPGEKPSLTNTGVARMVKTGADALNYVGAPLSVATDYLVGRPVSSALKMAGVDVSPQQVGDVTQMALPGLGALSEAKLAKAAKEAGISVESLKANLAARAQLHTNMKSQGPIERRTDSKARAAATLVNKAGLDTEEAGQKAKSLIGEHRTTGASKPVLLDVLGRTGKRVVRAAGARMGEADETLEAHRERVRGGLSGNVTMHAEGISPSNDTVADRIDSLKTQRENLAREKYREPYAQPIQTDDRIVEILDVPEALPVLSQAISSARNHSLDDPEAAQQFHELTSLRRYFDKKAAYEHELSEWEAEGGTQTPPANVPFAVRNALENPSLGENEKAALRSQYGLDAKGPGEKPTPPQPPQVSAGALDRVRRNLRDKAQTLSDAGKRDPASAYGDRQRALDEYLDQVPHLKEARAEYRDMSKRIEELQFDKDLASMRPEEFKRQLGDLNIEQRKERLHAVSERLAASLGKGARSAQALDDTIVTSPNFRANLRELMGPQGAHLADRFIRAIELERERLKTGTFASSSGGSRTMNLKSDLEEAGPRMALQALMGHGSRAIHTLAHTLTRGVVGMTDEEARQIAEWAVQEKDIPETIDEIAAALTRKPQVGKSPFPPDIAKIIAAHATADLPNEGKGDTSGGKPADKPADPFAKFSTTPDKSDDKPDDASRPDVIPDADAPADAAPDADQSDSLYDQLSKQYGVGGGGASDSGSDDLLGTVRKLEGSGDTAVSPKGAIGRFQITPDTAKTYGLDVSKLTDPVYAKEAATKILDDLSRRYGGDKAAILVAYNAGPGKADKWLAANKDPSVLPEETRRYLTRAGYDMGGASDSGGGDLYSQLAAQYGVKS